MNERKEAQKLSDGKLRTIVGMAITIKMIFIISLFVIRGTKGEKSFFAFLDELDHYCA